MELLNIGKTIIEGGALAMLLGLLTTLAVPKLRKRVWGNGNGSIQKQLDTIQDNHLHEIGKKLDELTNVVREGNDIGKKSLWILEERKKNGK